MTVTLKTLTRKPGTILTRTIMTEKTRPELNQYENFKASVPWGVDFVCDIITLTSYK